ncbi:hypothetical protein H2O64_13880 [Kordia sp. YSTF-M3]|uniref:Uncharacterized protein n=1 Tax=Kordia aestuariivivens TaxID=2759037 RepID=A0ABR7QB03_9FLAO|nr:hypothetical protein [Kordia aestuariivivens]MBC8755761.1 hypothetical protein [Kordia aestuariivivens]
MKLGIFNFGNKNRRKNIIEYLPDVGFIINSKKVKWRSDRLQIRKELNLEFQEDDKIIDLASFFDGDTSKNIHQKRDIYKKVNSDTGLIFLNYDSNNKLRDLEVHEGFEIKIGNIQLDFKTDISEFTRQFNKLGTQIVELEKGNFLLPKLKMTIADNESMGGDGKKLSYFYCSSDITHLLE